MYLAGVDLIPADDASVVANADVFALPFDLTGNVGGAANQTRNALEAMLVPAQGIVASMSWTAVGRYLAGLFQYMQRLHGVNTDRTGQNTILIDNVSKLNAQFNAIPADIQQDILTAAQSLGYDTSFIAGNTQIRQILKTLADAWGSQVFYFGPFTL